MHFCWGMASSMIFSLLPIFIVDELGGSSKSFGLLEGSVIFLSFIAKLFAGFIMDIFKKKLPMLKFGMYLTTLSKFSLACSINIFFAFIAKSIDRFAKGLRQAPSDAIFAELSSKKGLAYSFRHMMNLSGFFCGSFITTMIITSIGRNFRLIFSLAIVPTLIAIYIFKTRIKKLYDDDKLYKQRDNQKWKISDIKNMSQNYWKFIIIIIFLMLNRFSEGFITLRAKEIIPQSVASFPIFMSLYEMCAILISIPIGKIADKFDKRKILLFGVCLLITADIFGIFAYNLATLIPIYLFAGLHIGATQGLIGSIIAKIAHPQLIGTAFAIYYGIDGIVLFSSNNIAGLSCNIMKYLGLQNSSGPFVFGILCSIISSLSILNWIKKEKSF